MSYTLAEILKDSDYKQSQFDLIPIAEFEKRVTVKTDKNGKEIPYIQYRARKKEVRLTPEEAVRQLYLKILLNDYGYPADRIELEYNVTGASIRNFCLFTARIAQVRSRCNDEIG